MFRDPRSQLLSATKLHQCQLVDDNGILEEVTLFPFFERDGQVRRFMLIVPGEGEVYFFKPALYHLKRSIFGYFRLDGETALLPRMRTEHIPELAHLWHFDPWWMLGDVNYQHLDWVPFAKASNCPNHFSAVYFARDLHRVVKVCQSKKRRRKMVPFEAVMMPPRRNAMGASPSAYPKHWRKRWCWRKVWA